MVEGAPKTEASPKDVFWMRKTAESLFNWRRHRKGQKRQ
jgi:hypothetical protein